MNIKLNFRSLIRIIKKIEYIIDYHLIVECNERVWKEILNNYKQ